MMVSVTMLSLAEGSAKPPEDKRGSDFWGFGGCEGGVGAIFFKSCKIKRMYQLKPWTEQEKSKQQIW